MRTYRIQSDLNTAHPKRSADPVYSVTAGHATKKPKILMVGMHLEKTRGGITTLISAIVESDIRYDAEIKYIAAQAEDYGRFRKLFLAVAALAQFALYSISRRPELVYVHIGSNASLYREGSFVMLGKLLRLPVLTHFHAGDVEHYYPKQPAIGRWFIRKSIVSSDGLIAVSSDSARWLEALRPKAEVMILHNALDTSKFDERDGDSRKRSPGSVTKLLFVGAMGKLKGEIDLLLALKKLKADGVPVKASFLGYGSADPAKFAEQNDLNDIVEHIGPVSMDERIGYFQDADIFVLPTYAEAMPMSVIEAMASGLPVITTPVGGIPELIDEGVEGLYFPCGDIDALASQIRRLIDDIELREHLGRNALDKARSQFDISGYSQRLGSILQQMVEDNS